jgi:hypothetical protein
MAKSPFKGVDKDAHLEEGEENPPQKSSKISAALHRAAEKIDHVMHPDHKPSKHREKTASDIQNHPKFDKFKKGKS